MKLVCDNCGAIDYVLVDGYEVAGRLLEGVMFEVEDKDGKPHTIGVTARDEEYFDQFNQIKFILAMDALCETEEEAECPKCGEYIDIWGSERRPPTPIKQINITRGTDLLSILRLKQKI